jgi:hypothetical protein
LKFGLQVPVGREGLYIPSGFSSPDELMDLFRMAEELGFYSVWGTITSTLRGVLGSGTNSSLTSSKS